MKTQNGDLPAMPLFLTDAMVAASENGAHDAVNRVSGLSKRELFAAMAMQGLVSSGMDWTLFDYRDVSEQAVIMADSLLAQLERTK